jgi:hypothetical protein
MTNLGDDIAACSSRTLIHLSIRRISCVVYHIPVRSKIESIDSTSPSFERGGCNIACTRCSDAHAYMVDNVHPVTCESFATLIPPVHVDSLSRSVAYSDTDNVLWLDCLSTIKGAHAMRSNIDGLLFDLHDSTCGIILWTADIAGSHVGDDGEYSGDIGTYSGDDTVVLHVDIGSRVTRSA